MIFSADGAQWSEDQPNLILGLKGLMAAELIVTGARSDLHSGQHGGGVANPIQGAAQIIASMKGADGRITVAGFYDDVLDLTVDERAAIAAVPFDEAAYAADLGVTEPFGEAGFTVRERLWARAHAGTERHRRRLAGRGDQDGSAGRSARQDHLPLVANQRPDRVFDLLAAHVAAHTPPGLRARLDRLAGSADPFLAPAGHNATAVAAEVLAEVYGRAPYRVRTGGSIPVMTMLLNELGVHATVFAFGLPDENIHAPNEFFRLSHFRTGQTAWCQLLERLGQ